MKDNCINKFLLFLSPLLFFLGFFCFLFNVNFNINGTEYEVLFTDVLYLSFIFLFLYFVFYFIFSLFIKNKSCLTIFLFLVPLFLYRFSYFLGILFLLPFFVFFHFYKGDNKDFNTFFFLFTFFLSFISSFFFCFNFVLFTYQSISFFYRVETYDSKKEIVVSNKELRPNIYWIHMDGMPNLSFLKEYYDEPLVDFHQFLEENDFIVNEDASFQGGYHTMVALNALYNPTYYDEWLQYYLDDYYNCTLKRCKTKYTISFKELSKHRIQSELFHSFQLNHYKLVGIEEFNQYTAFYNDYTYDIEDITSRRGISFFNKLDSAEEVYDSILKHHYFLMANRFFQIGYPDDFEQEKIDYQISLKDYPLIDKTDFVEMKAMIQSIEDSRKRESESKFYFIDNTILHLDWIYDEEGNISFYGNDDLNDFDECYIYTTKLLIEFLTYIRSTDPTSIIVVQGDHGIHHVSTKEMMRFYSVSEEEVLNIRNSTISLISIPEEYRNGEEEYLDNPLNISRYLVNRFVGKNYDYLK